MKTIAVTGGSGAAGRFVVEKLVEEGYGVINIDRRAPSSDGAPFREVDITDYGSVYSAMDGADAVVHFAAHPVPDFDFHTGAQRFHNNTMGTYNVFQAAMAQGMKKVVWASSETTLGFPFEANAPVAVPVDENHEVQPQNSYALSKVVSEELAHQMNRLYGVPFIGLRFSNILFTGTWHHDNYERVPGYWQDLASRKFNLWSYIDARDAAASVVKALESDITTSENFIIAADDTIMEQPSRDLMAAHFPDVPVADDLQAHQSLISNRKAKDMLGFHPVHSWRDIVGS